VRRLSTAFDDVTDGQIASRNKDEKVSAQAGANAASDQIVGDDNQKTAGKTVADKKKDDQDMGRGGKTIKDVTDDNARRGSKKLGGPSAIIPMQRPTMTSCANGKDYDQDCPMGWGREADLEKKQMYEDAELTGKNEMLRKNRAAYNNGTIRASQKEAMLLNIMDEFERTEGFYKGPCKTLAELQGGASSYNPKDSNCPRELGDEIGLQGGWTDLQKAQAKSNLEKTCEVNWPCLGEKSKTGSAYVADNVPAPRTEVICPRGWTFQRAGQWAGYCTAPPKYLAANTSGSCADHVMLLGYSQGMKKQWAHSCNVSWPLKKKPPARLAGPPPEAPHPEKEEKGPPPMAITAEMAAEDNPKMAARKAGVAAHEKPRSKSNPEDAAWAKCERDFTSRLCPLGWDEVEKNGHTECAPDDEYGRTMPTQAFPDGQDNPQQICPRKRDNPGWSIDMSRWPPEMKRAFSAHCGTGWPCKGEYIETHSSSMRVSSGQNQAPRTEGLAKRAEKECASRGLEGREKMNCIHDYEEAEERSRVVVVSSMDPAAIILPSLGALFL